MFNSMLDMGFEPQIRQICERIRVCRQFYSKRMKHRELLFSSPIVKLLCLARHGRKKSVN